MTVHLLGILLVASLIVNSAEALMCFSCNLETSNVACNQHGPETCSASSDTCMTTESTIGDSYFISKQCAMASVCAAMTAGNIAGKYLHSSCCSSNLCNVNSAPPRSVRAASLLLLLPVGIGLLNVIGCSGVATHL
ncbi:unnamed protein product [Lampetra fluviatilis]